MGGWVDCECGWVWWVVYVCGVRVREQLCVRDCGLCKNILCDIRCLKSR